MPLDDASDEEGEANKMKPNGIKKAKENIKLGAKETNLASKIDESVGSFIHFIYLVEDYLRS
jgi:hypothetical protein